MRRVALIDDKLDNLILERDSLRIQMSLIADRAPADAEEIADLRTKARELEDMIAARQRAV